MSFVFKGSPVTAVDSKSTVVVCRKAVYIDSTNTYVVRGDGTEHRIQMTGRVTEIGGQGVSIDGAQLILGNGVNCESGATEARCINIERSSGMVELTRSLLHSPLD